LALLAAVQPVAASTGNQQMVGVYLGAFLAGGVLDLATRRCATRTFVEVLDEPRRIVAGLRAQGRRRSGGSRRSSASGSPGLEGYAC